MNTIKKIAVIVLPIIIFAVISTPAAEAYYVQPRVGSYTRHYAVPRSTFPAYGYGYQFDTVGAMIQGHLNFVSNFTYIPAPIPLPSYFYPSYRYGYRW